MFGQRVSDNWPVYNAMNGVVLQNPAGQLSGLADTVADEIAFDLINQGMAEGLIQKRVEEVATQMGLIEQLNLRPESLSGGQIQRLAIATAIAVSYTHLGRGHLPNSGVLLDLAKTGHLLTSNLRNPVHIIAEEIYNHHIFRSIFGVRF